MLGFYMFQTFTPFGQPKTPKKQLLPLRNDKGLSFYGAPIGVCFFLRERFQHIHLKLGLTFHIVETLREYGVGKWELGARGSNRYGMHDGVSC